MNTTRLIALFLLTAVVMAVSSCRDDNGPASSEATLYDIVCLSAIDKSGSTFTLTKPDCDRVITYSAGAVIDTAKVAMGDRLMLAYTPDNGVAYTSGRVTVKGYAQINNDRLRIGHIDSIPGWDRDAVYLLSAWMSENYLNLRARITFDTKPRSLFVMIDSATVDTERPVCYLIHRMAEPTVNFERAIYLSVDMSALGKLETCKGFELRLHDTNLNLESMTFDIKDLKY